MAGRFIDFMAQGLDADLPAAASMPAKIVAGSAAIYYANDSQKWYFFNEDTVAWDLLDLSILTGLLADLGDVDFTTPPTDGQMLAYDFAASKWMPMDVPAGYDDSMADARIAAASVGDLNDVDLSTPATNGQALIWDTDHFEPQSIPAGYTDEMARDALGTALIGGTGITVTVDDGADTITIDSDITQYTDGMADARVAAGIAAASIDDLGDVDTSTTPPTDGQALIWDNVNSEWIPGDVAGGSGVQWVVDDTGTGASQVVTLPQTVSDGNQILVFVNGIKWKASEYSVAGTSLTITTNASGDAIQVVGVATDGTSELTGTIGSLKGITKLRKNAVQNIVAGAWRTVTWDVEDYDNLGAFTGGSSTSNITVPAGIQWARFSLRGGWANNSASARYIRLTDAANTGNYLTDIRLAANETLFSLCSGWVPVVAATVLHLEVNSGTQTLNLGDASFGGYPELTIEWAENLSAMIQGSVPSSIDALSDVDTTTVAPVTGDRLKWNGSNWVPGQDWQLAGSWTWSTNVANVDFTDLAGYTELLVVVQGVAVSVSGVALIQLSTNNGSTFYSTSGDYLAIDSAGTAANTIGFSCYGTDSTAARYGMVHLMGLNIPGIPKPGALLSPANTPSRLFVADNANDVDAIRLLGSAGGNLTAGSIYVLGRK